MTGNQIGFGLRFAKFVRENNPDLPIVWGGIHPTMMSEQTLLNPYVDIIVRGEVEQTLLELVEALKNNRDIKNIKGIAYKKKWTGSNKS